MLMPPLIEKWNVLKDEDKDLFPLLEVGVSSNFSMIGECLTFILFISPDVGAVV